MQLLLCRQLRLCGTKAVAVAVVQTAASVWVKNTCSCSSISTDQKQSHCSSAASTIVLEIVVLASSVLIDDSSKTVLSACNA